MKRLAMAIVASAIAAACSSSTPAGPGPIAAGNASTADAKPSTASRRTGSLILVATRKLPPRDNTRARTSEVPTERRMALRCRGS